MAPGTFRRSALSMSRRSKTCHGPATRSSSPPHYGSARARAHSKGMELSEKTVRCTDHSIPSPVPAACLFANSPALLTSSSAWLVEAAISSQFRRQPCHGGHDEKCAYSAGDDRNNWTKKIGDQTGFER